MSINNQKVVDLCKKEKHLRLYTEGDRQWIATSGSVYPLLKAPHLDESSLRALYSIPDNVRVDAVEGLPGAFSFADAVRYEQPVFYEKIQLQPLEEELALLRTSQGVTFIREQYLKPLEKGENGPADLYERINENGLTYIVAKQGLMLEAVILPMRRVIREGFLEDLKDLFVALKRTFEKERDAE